jgi:hypothetical protein
MITAYDVHEFLEKMAGEEDWLYNPADSKLKDEEKAPPPKEKAPPPKEKAPPPAPSGRQRVKDPEKDSRLLEDKDLTIKGRPSKPTGGCTIDSKYYNPCPKNPNRPGL